MSKKQSKPAARKKVSAATTRRSTRSNSTARPAETTAESLRGDAHRLSNKGTEAARNFSENANGEARRARDNIYAFSRESAENVARSADAASRNVQEAVAVSRDLLEACVESGNVATDMTKELSSGAFNYANTAFTQNVELTKDFFGCRTLNDMFELQNRVLRTTLDQYFSESAKWSNLFFKYASEAAEPFAERISEVGTRFNKHFAA